MLDKFYLKKKPLPKRASILNTTDLSSHPDFAVSQMYDYVSSAPSLCMFLALLCGYL